MKPYRTSYLRVAAFMMLVSSLSFFHTQSANADCKFTISTVDTAWSFSAAAGATQVRELVITNTSDSTITVTAGITGTSRFGLNHDQFTIAVGDTVSLFITFQPPAGSTAGSVTGSLRIATSNSDCRRYLTLVGVVPGTTNGGHDKVVTMSPSSSVFGPIAAGSDTCNIFYLVNYTGVSVTVSSLSFGSGTDFSMTPAFNGVTMDSGGYYRFSVCFKGDASNSRVTDSLFAIYQYAGATHLIASSLLGYTSTPLPPVILAADPHEYSFGTVAFGTTACKDIIITNTSKDVIMNFTVFSGCTNSDFSITPKTFDSFSAGSSKTVTICYTPHAAGISESCGFTIKYSDITTMTDGALSISVGGNSGTDSTHNTTSCLKTEQGSNYHDAVVVGGTAEHTLYLINTSSRSITVDSAYITGTDAGVFSIASTLPITVPANTSTTTLMYTFAPTSNSKSEFNGLVTLSLNGDSLDCHSVQGYLIGYVVKSINTVDTVVRPLFPNEKRTLGLEGNGATVSTTFYFTNNLTVDCTVNKIYLASGQYFQIASTNPTPTPFVLHPGDNLTVIVTYTATDHIVHHDSLMIDANHNLQAQSFELQGIQLAVNSIATLPVGVAINVSPNPASSYVTVDMAGVRSADIQVIDLLGNIVTTTKANSSWRWDASNFVSGSYIVRIAGVSATGEQFVASKRIIVSK